MLRKRDLELRIIKLEQDLYRLASQFIMTEARLFTELGYEYRLQVPSGFYKKETK